MGIQVIGYVAGIFLLLAIAAPLFLVLNRWLIWPVWRRISKKFGKPELSFWQFMGEFWWPW